jgi:hypothetical protein
MRFDSRHLQPVRGSPLRFHGGGVLVPVEHHLARFYDEVREAIAR